MTDELYLDFNTEVCCCYLLDRHYLL